MRKFFNEFKAFISRGNVMDLAVGVIVGGAFTAIVTALSDNILKPIINWLLVTITGQQSLSEVYTFLKKVTLLDGSVDLANSVYIDWGAFINAIINFVLIAFVLFCIVKVVNKLNDGAQELAANSKALSKAEKKALIKEGKSLKEIQEIEKAKIAEQKRLAEEAAAAVPAKPTTDEILAEILTVLKNK